MGDSRNLKLFNDRDEEDKLAKLYDGASSDYAQVELILHYLQRYGLTKHAAALIRWRDKKIRTTVAEGGWRANQFVTVASSENGKVTPDKVGTSVQVNTTPSTNGSQKQPSFWEKLNMPR